MNAVFVVIAWSFVVVSHAMKRRILVMLAVRGDCWCSCGSWCKCFEGKFDNGAGHSYRFFFFSTQLSVYLSFILLHGTLHSLLPFWLHTHFAFVNCTFFTTIAFGCFVVVTHTHNNTSINRISYWVLAHCCIIWDQVWTGNLLSLLCLFFLHASINICFIWLCKCNI